MDDRRGGWVLAILGLVVFGALSGLIGAAWMRQTKLEEKIDGTTEVTTTTEKKVVDNRTEKERLIAIEKHELEQSKQLAEQSKQLADITRILGEGRFKQKKTDELLGKVVNEEKALMAAKTRFAVENKDASAQARFTEQFRSIGMPALRSTVRSQLEKMSDDNLKLVEDLLVVPAGYQDAFEVAYQRARDAALNKD